MAVIIQNVGNSVRTKLVRRSPYRTGNLRYNGIGGLMSIGANAVVFEIGGQNAPYGVLLNDNSTIRGRSNKHYLWIDNAIDDIANEIAKELGGYVL